jgi:hypothetical protein
LAGSAAPGFRRLDCYTRRKRRDLAGLQADVERLASQQRFTAAVASGELAVFGQPRATLLAALAAAGYPTAGMLAARRAEGGPAAGRAEAGPGAYDYLLNTPVWQLTGEAVTGLEQRHAAALAEREALVRGALPSLPGCLLLAAARTHGSTTRPAALTPRPAGGGGAGRALGGRVARARPAARPGLIARHRA